MISQKIENEIKEVVFSALAVIEESQKISKDTASHADFIIKSIPNKIEKTIKDEIKKEISSAIQAEKYKLSKSIEELEKPIAEAHEVQRAILLDRADQRKSNFLNVGILCGVTVLCACILYLWFSLVLSSRYKESQRLKGEIAILEHSKNTLLKETWGGLEFYEVEHGNMIVFPPDKLVQKTTTDDGKRSVVIF